MPIPSMLRAQAVRLGSTRFKTHAGRVGHVRQSKEGHRNPLPGGDEQKT
jgi:hypothetical protein